MSTVTYEFAPVAAATGGVAKRPGWFRRFVDRLIEARARQALDEIKRHSHLLPRELDQTGWKVTSRSEDSLPFLS